MGKTLVCMMGLPRSGKSTRVAILSRRLASPIVNPDAIRRAIHGHAFVATAEPFVWAVAKVMVRALFLAGHAMVLVDATNTTRKRRDEWQDPDWKTGFVHIDTSAEECIRRARADIREDLVAVIERQAAALEPLGKDETAWTEAAGLL